MKQKEKRFSILQICVVPLYLSLAYTNTHIHIFSLSFSLSLSLSLTLSLSLYQTSLFILLSWISNKYQELKTAWAVILIHIQIFNKSKMWKSNQNVTRIQHQLGVSAIWTCPLFELSRVSFIFNECLVCLRGVYFKVFTSWPRSPMAAWPQIKFLSTS